MNNLEERRIYSMKETDRFVHLTSVSDLKFVEITNFDMKIVMNYVVKDKDLKQTYFFEVENNLITNREEIGRQIPFLTLSSPKIRPNLDIHLLSDYTICYVFPGDIRYDRGLTCAYAIEQSFKWAFGYEFYLKKGYWPFLEMPHGIYPNQWGFYRPSMVA